MYCDLFEHLILHALIIKETKGRFSVNGYVGFLYPDADKWFVQNSEPSLNWMRVCKERAFLYQDDAKDLLSHTNEIIEPFVPKFIISEDELARMKEQLVEYQKERKRKEVEYQESKKREETIKINNFKKKYPQLQKINVNINTPRKKFLNLLYERAYSKDFFKRKDFYDSKLTFIRDELLEELNEML